MNNSKESQKSKKTSGKNGSCSVCGYETDVTRPCPKCGWCLYVPEVMVGAGLITAGVQLLTGNIPASCAIGIACGIFMTSLTRNY